MRELALRCPLTEIRRVQGYGFIDELRQSDVEKIHLISCQQNHSRWLCQVGQPIDVEAMAAVGQVEDVVLLYDGDGVYEYLLVVENPDRWSFTGCPADVICQGGVDVTGDGIEVVLVAPQSTIDRISRTLAELDVDCEILRIGDYRGMEGLLSSLTRRQRDLLCLAFESGYYDAPRRTSVEELADDVGLDKSTVWEHLRRAEQNLLSAILEGKGPSGHWLTHGIDADGVPEEAE